MFTVLVLANNHATIEIMGVHHFNTKAEAQAFEPKGANCSVFCKVMPGQLTEEQALEELLW